MTDQDLPPCGDFFDALDLYRGAFRDVPDTFPLPPGRLDALTPAMQQAVTRGNPNAVLSI
jgi:hypothetical protein